MTPIVIVLIAGAGLVSLLTVVAVAFAAGDDSDDFGLDRGGDGGTRWFGRLRPDVGGDRMTGLAATLLRADLRLKPAEWILVMASLAVVAAAIFGAIFANLLAAVVGGLLALVVCQLFLALRLRRRTALFEAQLVDALLTLRSALRAGSSFPQALAAVARSTPAPCGDEFSRVIREIDLGLPMDRSLNNLVERNDSEDLALLVVAVQVHREVGGNLARTVERISRVIQDRLRVKGDVRVLTAQPRLAGTALALLPIVLGLVLAILSPGGSPNYFSPMLNEPLGIIALGLAAMSVAIGYYVLRRIARVDFY